MTSGATGRVFFYIMVGFYWEYQLNLYMFVFKGKSFAKWCQWNILPTNGGAFLWEIRPLQIRFHLVRPKDRKNVKECSVWVPEHQVVMRAVLSFLFTSYSILWRALGSKMGVCIGQMIAITVKGAASKVAAQQNAKAALPGGHWKPNYDQSYSHNGST